jgi:hypothetical protein
MNESYIQIEKDGLKTVIVETDFKSGGYQEAGWKIIETDWTKQREIKERINYDELMKVENMANGFKKQ